MLFVKSDLSVGTQVGAKLDVMSAFCSGAITKSDRIFDAKLKV